MTKHEIEYEEAPSGNVTFYNYKEPLMKFDGGYGYIGALIFDTETDKVQCHLCGEWLGQLAHHLHREHNITASQYKEMVGLFQTTALIGEKTREKLIASGLDKRLQNLRQAHLIRKKNGFKKTQETIEKIRATTIKNGIKPEGMNLRGTCPAQLLNRLKKDYEREGVNFSFRRHVAYDYLLKKTFGSVKEACQLADVPYRTPGTTNTNRTKYTEEVATDFIKEFIARFNRRPNRNDFNNQGQRGLYNKFFMGNKKKLRKMVNQAYMELDEYKKPQDRIQYTKEALLKFLRSFEKGNGRKPSTSDGKRGLIPPPQTYIYHFGNWANALNLAFQ